QGDAHHRSRRREAGPGGGPGPRRPRGHGLPGRGGGELLPHGARGRFQQRDAGSEGMDRVMQASREREHTLSVLVENRPGVLSRVAGLFSRRGFNIESIVVGTTEDRRYSRMTIVVTGDEAEVEQVTKQLHKLIEVIKISELAPQEMVERELALIKVSAD